MIEAVRKLSNKFASIIVIGGEKDIDLLRDFNVLNENVVLAIGSLPIMSSAEIIRGASLLVANDSAPVHIASAFNVPTVAIFGPTVKDFGFYPYHKRSVVVEVEGLGCRPCLIHGGRRCPIVTFDCMRKISPDEIVMDALKVSERTRTLITQMIQVLADIKIYMSLIWENPFLHCYPCAAFLK